MGQGTETRAATWKPNLGPLGYVWDQLPVRLRAPWRQHVGLDAGRILGFEYAKGLRGIGVVLGPDAEHPLSETVVKTHIRRRGLPVMRPLAGTGFPCCGKLISPLSQLLTWGEAYLGRDWHCTRRPLSRDEVE